MTEESARLTDLRVMREALIGEIERLRSEEPMSYEARGRDMATIVKELRAVVAEIGELAVTVADDELSRLRAQHVERRGSRAAGS